MKCFCNANIVFFIKHLATQLIILIHAKHKINGILGISFPCFCAGFTRIPVTFLSSLAVLTRYSETLKCSAQYRRDHESGASVKICIFSEYVVVVKFSFIKLCKRSSSDAFCSVSEITLTDSELAS